MLEVQEERAGVLLGRIRREDGVSPKGAERLAAVPHDSGEEAQVGGREWTAEEGQLVLVGEIVWVVHLHQVKLRAPRDGQADPDQRLVEKHAVCRPSRGDRRNV